MVVSDVTNDFSDDCDSTLVTVDAIYLPITQSRTCWAFHHPPTARGGTSSGSSASPMTGQPFNVGFLSQAPLGDLCVTHFDTVVYSTGTPTEFRDGR